MKKQLIAMILSAVMIAGNPGPAPLYAAETPDWGVSAQEAQEDASMSDAPKDGPSVEESVDEYADGASVDGSAEGASVDGSADGASVDESMDDASMSEEGITVREEQPETGTEQEEPAGEAGTNENTDSNVTDTEKSAAIEPTIQNETNEAADTQAEVVESGMCGEHVTWTLTVDENDPYFNKLRISGSGDMYDYETTNGHWMISSVDRVKKQQMAKSAGAGRGFLLAATMPGTSPWDRHFEFISEVIVDDGVTSIGDYAFAYFYNCTSIEIPDSVTRIGSHAFQYCAALTELTLPAELTEIGDYAFSGCSMVTSIAVPDGVTEIGDHAFSECNALTGISLPDGITEIKEGTFEECRNLTDIQLPEEAAAIGPRAFAGCRSMTDISLPEGLTTIGPRAFYDCQSLTSITLPAGITAIEDCLFIECRNLKSVQIPDGVTSIGEWAFENCCSLESIALPDSVNTIGPNAFRECLGLTEITVPGFNTVPDEMAFFGLSQPVVCYTVHGSYIAENIPTYDGTNSSFTIVYLDDIEDSPDTIAFCVDPIVMKAGETIYPWDWLMIPGDLDYTQYYLAEVSNEDVFSYSYVNDCLVSSGPGETYFTYIFDDIRATVKVIAVDGDVPEAEGMAFQNPEMTVKGGEWFSNPLVPVPENSNFGEYGLHDYCTNHYNTGCYYTVSDTSVVEEKDGFFKAVGAGTATVSYVIDSTSEVLASFEVTVEQPSCTLIVEEKDIEVEKGTVYPLNVELYNAHNETLSYSSSDAGVAEVSPAGEVTGVGFGTAVITVSCGNVSKDVKVTVPCPLTGISFEQARMQMSVGDLVRLSVIYQPEYTTDREVEWSSDDPDIVEAYPNGFISAQQTGTTVIHASAGGFTADMEITVGKGVPVVDDPGVIEAFCGQTLSELELPECFEWENPDRNVGNAGEKTFAARYIPYDLEQFEIVEGYMITVNVSHHYSEEWTSGSGTHWHECACGEKTDESVHEYTDWTLVKPATCTESAEIQRTCSVCGHTDVFLFPAGGHVWMKNYTQDAAPTCTEPGSESIHCAVCDQIREGTSHGIPAAGHRLTFVDEVPATEETAGNTEYYRCETCGKLFSDENSEHEITEEDTVIPPHAPVGIEILSGPADTTALAGERVVLTVEAQGDGLQYRWQYSKDGTAWRNCTSAGYNTDTFAFVMKESLSGRRYRCLVSSGEEFAATEPAEISLTPVEITGAPDDVTAAEGEEVILIVSAGGVNLNYQWQYSTNGTTWRNCSSAGANTDTFRFTMKASASGRLYRCMVTGGSGETVSVASEPALITLAEAETKLEILSQPANVEAAAGETVVLHVEAAGANPRYQWQYTSNGTTWKNCSSGGYNTDTFSFTMKATLSGRRYRCIVTCGEDTFTSDPAAITLK